MFVDCPYCKKNFFTEDPPHAQPAQFPGAAAAPPAATPSEDAITHSHMERAVHYMRDHTSADETPEQALERALAATR